jgi:hypothetical protein
MHRATDPESDAKIPQRPVVYKAALATKASQRCRRVAPPPNSTNTEMAQPYTTRGGWYKSTATRVPCRHRLVATEPPIAP